MGFKTNASFLRSLKKGAAGVREVKTQLTAAGFQPIELDRGCLSNKIWATKNKGFRLPDLLCVNTGLRIEVRAKSSLKIQMSDTSSERKDRSWDAGLRKTDLVAFVACFESGKGLSVAEEVNYFCVEDLASSVAKSNLGKSKSAAEGSESTREWPSYVSTRSGVVTAVDEVEQTIKLDMHGNGTQAQKQHVVKLNGRVPYVRKGDAFRAGTTIIAGAPNNKVALETYPKLSYDPLTALASVDFFDRYCAIKALRWRADTVATRSPSLEALIRDEPDQQLVLEAAAAAGALGSKDGMEHIRKVLHGAYSEDLKMEAVFILTELQTPDACECLTQIASTRTMPSELRQAAAWGLGAVGCRRYSKLVGLIDDPDEKVALHAIAAFGADADEETIAALLAKLNNRAPRLAYAASEALRVIGSPAVARAVSAALLNPMPHTQNWLIATLGRLRGHDVREHLHDKEMLSRIEPLLLLNDESNWLISGGNPGSLASILEQR